MEILLDPNHSNSRIQSLCGFQLKALTHAATAFPTVRRIVYSTCSLYKAENERLVNLFLEENGNDWKLIAPKCLAAWERRGLAEDTRSSTTDVDLPKTPLTDAERRCLIRVDPQQDATNGFFVACLQRKTSGREYNEAPLEIPARENVKEKSPSKIEMYHNQFHDMHPKSTKSIKEDSSSKRSNFGLPKEMGNQPEIQDRSGVAEPKKPHISKKRAKKLEWKWKQHERKIERLKLAKS